jgi:hypothetical protein
MSEVSGSAHCFLMTLRLRRARSSLNIVAVRLLSFVALVAWCFAFALPARAAPRVAVQPFGGSETEPLRKQVASIVGKHGFRVLASLAQVSGTSQYPGLAKDRNLSAFVVADVVEKGTRVSVSFLIWQGIDGSVLGRWEVAGPKKKIASRLGKEFWKRLGPAIEKALPPPSDYLPPAPPMRINAGTPIADSTGPT